MPSKNIYELTQDFVSFNNGREIIGCHSSLCTNFSLSHDASESIGITGPFAIKKSA